MSTPNMPDLILLTQQIAKLKSDVEGVKDRVVDLEEGGGGGGAAYPDNVIIAEATGAYNLTTDDQGVVTSIAEGTVFNLPTSAGNGTTYKFVGGPNILEVNSGGKLILSYFSTSFKVNSFMKTTLIAFNIDMGSGLDLVWFVLSDQVRAGWNAEVNYLIGDMVTNDSRVYMSIAPGNINRNPATEVDYWLELVKVSQDNGSAAILDSDVTVSGGTPPVYTEGAVGSVSYFYSGQLKRLTVTLSPAGTPGAGNTTLQINLTSARGVNPNIPTFSAEEVIPVLAIPVGSGAVPCVGIFNPATDTISITFPAAVDFSELKSAAFVW